MIRGLVESMIGAAGASVLQFYEAHALVLGLVIVLYGILMYLSWSNLVRIYRYLVATAAATLTPSDEPGSQQRRRHGARASKPKTGRPGLTELPWQEAVDKARFPLVSRRAGLLPMRKSIEAAKSIIDERELWEHARLVANGVDLRRIAPEYRLMGPRQVEKHGKD